MKITVVGGGNIGTQFAVHIAEKGHDITFAEYEKGGHGFGMNNNKFLKRTHWNEDLYNWIVEKGFAKLKECKILKRNQGLVFE